MVVTIAPDVTTVLTAYVVSGRERRFTLPVVFSVDPTGTLPVSAASVVTMSSESSSTGPQAVRKRAAHRNWRMAGGPPSEMRATAAAPKRVSKPIARFHVHWAEL